MTIKSTTTYQQKDALVDIDFNKYEHTTIPFLGTTQLGDIIP
jgi:hypothetical protein